ncbi:MAG: phosphotransferase [Actinomycetota bacterium]
MADLPLIHEPDEMSAEWLTAALVGSFPGAVVTAFSAAPVGTGLMARSYRLRLEGEGPIPPSVVAKVPSDEASTRELGARAYRREVGFYRDLAARVDGRVPACHHADISDSGTEFVLVLEDITPAGQGDQIEGCSIDEATRAIDNLARLHASTWGRDDAPDWLDDGAGSGQDLAFFMQLAMDAFEPRFADLVEPEAMEVFRRFAAAATAWLSGEPPTRAMVHGDYRLDNLLFSTVDASVAAVDWQTVSFASPARDLAYFLGNSLRTEDRRAHEDALIAQYLDVLRSIGVEHDESTLRSELVHGAFQGPLVTAIGAFTATRTERSEGMFAAMANRCGAQILDHGGMSVL